MGGYIQERISRKLFLISSASEPWAGLWTKPKLVSNEGSNSIGLVLELSLNSYYVYYREIYSQKSWKNK